MSTGGYKITDQGAMYFVSFAVVSWVDVFTRKDYRDIVIESLKFCQVKKGHFAFCRMTLAKASLIASPSPMCDRYGQG